MTALPARPFKLEQFNDTSLWQIVKRHWTPLNLSLTHAVACLILGPLALFYHADTWDITQWFTPGGYIHHPTGWAISACFLMSCVYYLWDTVCIFKICNIVSNGKLIFDDYGYLFHHLACGLGMFFPAVLGVDGSLVHFAFLQGEFSNPPRGIAEALEYEMESMKTAVTNGSITEQDLKKHGLTKQDLQKRFELLFDKWLTCLDFHFYGFCLFRVILTYYTFFCVLPYAKLTLTFVAAVFMTIFSIGSVFVLVPSRIKRAQNIHKLRQLYDEDVKKAD